MKNVFTRPEHWLTLVRMTLIELRYPSDIQLSKRHWLCLFHEDMMPTRAIAEMEGIDLIAVVMAWSRLPKEVIDTP